MQENIVLKIKFNDDIRRVRLIEKGFIGLQKQIGEIYSIQQGTFTLKYRDDEGDLVTISSEEEFSESFKFIQNNILRLEITSLLEKKEGEGRCKRRWKGKCHKGNRDNHHHGHRHQGQHPFGFIHNITNNLNEGVLNNLINSGLCHIEHNYVCDGCESKIRGTRYHCSECPDFDFCSGCYETKLDSHPEHKFVAITAFDALKEAIGNGEQIDSFFEIFQPGQQQEQVQGSTVDQEHEKEIFEQERHKQQIEKERLEQERIQQEQEQERIKQEQLEKERIEQERLEKERVEQERIEQERIKQEQEQEKVNQQEEPKNVEPQPQQPQPQPQPNKTFFENFKDILFPLRNPEPVNNDTFEKKLEDLTSMGFDKKECIKALVQNKGNIQKAVEVLLKKK